MLIGNAMSKDWRPVIDESRCIDDCNKCLAFCPQMVFEKAGRRPKVVHPIQCIDGCEGCKSVCERSALSFARGRAMIIDGKSISVDGLDDALQMSSESEGFRLILERNYVPEDMKKAYEQAFHDIFPT
jgi:NAD-dependent dihydropyrimidine dehydrogenase PreA subunit